MHPIYNKAVVCHNYLCPGIGPFVLFLSIKYVVSDAKLYYNYEKKGVYCVLCTLYSIVYCNPHISVWFSLAHSCTEGVVGK